MVAVVRRAMAMLSDVVRGVALLRRRISRRFYIAFAGVSVRVTMARGLTVIGRSRRMVLS